MKSKFTDLEVWQNAVSLAVMVFEKAATFPTRATRLADQMTAAAVSVPSNIAEGKGRLTDRESRRFMGIARGSLFELQTQTVIAKKIGLIPLEDATQLEDLIGRVGRQLNGLIRYLEHS